MLPKICSILVARKLMGAKFSKNVEMFLFGRYKKGRFLMREN